MCKNIIFILISNLLFFLSARASDHFSGVWSGIEVMGADKKTAQYIRSIIPVKIGSEFSSEHSNMLKEWCENVKKKLENDSISCSYIGYGDKKFYFNVEVISPSTFQIKEDLEKNEQGKSYQVPRKLSKLFDQWDDRFWYISRSGNFPKEQFVNGHLDFDDKKLHALSVKMATLSRQYNQKLLEVIRYSQDSNERSRAASLLSWHITPENISYILKYNLLKDPDAAVRNDLARSMTFILDKLDDYSLAEATNAFCQQAKLHSHGDRNKALYSIQAMMKHNPKVLKSMNSECIKTIEYISEMSILPNVGGLAKDILENIDKSKNEKNTNFK